jgi:hypothetical protein
MKLKTMLEALVELADEHLPKWLTPCWYKYLFIGCSGLRNLWCRATGHRSIYWYNVGGTEPDTHCTGCGEDIG